MERIILNGLDEEVFYEKSFNGIDVYMVPNLKVNNYYITFNVKFGSIHTEFKEKGRKRYTKVPNGIAHFLEHQMFYQQDGSVAHTFFANTGSFANATTTYKYTFYEVIASDNISKNLNYLLDYVQEPYFIKKNVDAEKGIITEEIKMGIDSPSRQLFDRINSNLYIYTNYKHSIAGTEEDIKNTTAEKIMKCYENFYHPNNMFIVITGNFKPLEVLTIINDNQSKKEFLEFKNPIIKNVKEPTKVVKEYEEIEMNVKIPKLSIGYKISRKKFGNIDDIKLRKYLQIILAGKFDAASDLTEKLVENNIISSSIFVSNFIDKDIVTLFISTESKYPDECIKIINEEMNNLSVDKELLERKKKASISDLIMAFDDIQLVNEIIQTNIILYDKIIDNEFNILKKLNLNEANEIIKNISPKIKTVLVIKPLKTI